LQATKDLCPFYIFDMVDRFLS